ncbi:MAG: hypothetical protein ACI4EG_11500 [Fusicatenibacter sp.]
MIESRDHHINIEKRVKDTRCLTRKVTTGYFFTPKEGEKRLLKKDFFPVQKGDIMKSDKSVGGSSPGIAGSGARIHGGFRYRCVKPVER